MKTPSVIAIMKYDGLGRRNVKQITNSADWDGTYRYWYDDQRVVEIRNGSGRVLKQFAWGIQYIDELLWVGVNPSTLPLDSARGLERVFESKRLGA